MIQKLTLTNVIQINGNNVKELKYDIEEITGVHFAEADARKMKASGSKSGNLAGAVELDYSLQLYLGYAAIIAVNPDIDWNDLERIKGHDLMEVIRIGRNFIMRSVVDSQESDSEEPSETTPDVSTPQLSTSKKSD